MTCTRRRAAVLACLRLAIRPPPHRHARAHTQYAQATRTHARALTDTSSAPAQLLQHVPVLIYNGDVDACVPYNSNEDWVVALSAQQGYAQVGAWRPWKLGNVPAGYVTTYAAPKQNLTFLTVKESGHMVPQYQPARAFAFFERWLTGASF